MPIPIDEDAVAGLCHLVAYEIDETLPDEEIGSWIVALETKESAKKWHYGVLLEDGRILDSKGGWDSIDDFREAANETWEHNFRVVMADVPEEEVEIFNETDRRKARGYARKLIESTDLM